MSTQTPNYGLTKPTYPESADVEIINGNMDIIDTQMKTNADGIGSVSADVTTLETKVEKINAKDKAQDLKIKKLEAAAEGELYITDEDDDVAYIKDVDADALPVAMLTKLGGRTIVANQNFMNGNFQSTNYIGGTMTRTVTDNVLVAKSINGTDNSIVLASGGFTVKLNHKYYSAFSYISDIEFKHQGYETTHICPISSNWKRTSFIETLSGTSYITKYFFNYDQLSDNEWTLQLKNYISIDLTQMFGAGNEPSTVEEVEAIIGTDYIAYNTGSLESADTSKIVCVGFNIWDEEWEAGRISDTTGENITGSNSIRSKNYIPCIPNTSYYYKPHGNTRQILAYDTNKNFISALELTNLIFTTPNNCSYIRFWDYKSSDGSTYHNDICVNVSGSADGTYKPYFHSEAPIPQAIRSLQCYGKSANDMYKFELNIETKKANIPINELDMSTLNWTFHSTSAQFTEFFDCNVSDIKKGRSGEIPILLNTEYTPIISGHIATSEEYDQSIAVANNNTRLIVQDLSVHSVADLIAKLQGKTLIYAMETPIETDLSNILTDDFLIEVEGGGTIEFVGNEDYNIPVPSTEVFYLKTV